MNRRPRGFTLVETLMAVAILGIFALTTKAAIDLMNNLTFERTHMQSQREAEMALLDMTRDVRNCMSISAITDNSMTLKMFDTRGGTVFDTDKVNSLLDSASLKPVTYTFVQDASGSYIDRHSNFDSEGPRDRRLAIGILSPPTAAVPMFENDLGAVPPPGGYDDVRITLQIKDPKTDAPVRNYTIHIEKRGSAS